MYLARDIPPFVMYCVNGKPRSSLLNVLRQMAIIFSFNQWHVSAVSIHQLLYLYALHLHQNLVCKIHVSYDYITNCMHGCINSKHSNQDVLSHMLHFLFENEQLTNALLGLDLFLSQNFFCRQVVYAYVYIFILTKTLKAIDYQRQKICT